jgi:hypothetical protein
LKAGLVVAPLFAPTVEHVRQLERMHRVNLQAANRPTRRLCGVDVALGNRERLGDGGRERVQKREPELFEACIRRIERTTIDRDAIKVALFAFTDDVGHAIGLANAQ